MEPTKLKAPMAGPACRETLSGSGSTKLVDRFHYPPTSHPLPATSHLTAAAAVAGGETATAFPTSNEFSRGFHRRGGAEQHDAWSSRSRRGGGAQRHSVEHVARARESRYLWPSPLSPTRRRAASPREVSFLRIAVC